MRNEQVRFVFIAIFMIPVVLMVQSVGCADDKTEPQPQIVKRILNVTYHLEKSNPPNFVVTAVGEVPTPGYKKVELLRVNYDNPRSDGIQDYILFAVPPSGFVPQVISQVEACNIWRGQSTYLKGIRVHGIGDGMIVKIISDK